jgi:hypothetical protein
MLVPHVCLGVTVAQALEVKEVAAHRHQMCGEIQEEISIQIVHQWVSWQWQEVDCMAEGDKSTGTTG